MSEKRDRGGSLVTDYSRSKMDPERAAKLNKAELDYVNGIWDADREEWTWPSYPDLAEKYDLPLRLINEQAGQHKWVSRRERRKTEMIAFQNEQTRKRWLEEDRAIMGILMHNIGKNVQLIARVQDEQYRMAENAMRKEQERREAGEENPIELSGVRAQTLKELAAANAEAMKTAKALSERIVGLPTVLPEIAPPVLIKTVEQERADEKDAEKLQAPDELLLEIYGEMAKIEQARKRDPRVVAGQLEAGDDEDDEDGTPRIEVVG